MLLDDEEMGEELKLSFEKRHSELVKIILSFENLEKSREWETLKELVFSKQIESLEDRLLITALEHPLDQAKIYRLQGELLQAKKYNLPVYIENLKKQLEDINKKIK